MTREEFESMIGEGFHTAFRKAVDSATASQIHRLIDGMDPRDWSEIVAFVADGFPPEMFAEPAQPMPTGEEFLKAFGRPDLAGPADQR